MGTHIVGEINGIVAGGAAGADTGGRGRQDFATGRGKVGDIVLEGDGDPVRKTVGGHGKGQVSQCKDGPALGGSGGVAVAGLQNQLADGPA